MDPQSWRSFLDALIKNPALYPVYDKNGVFQKSFCNCGVRLGARFQGCDLFNNVDDDAEAEIIEIIHSGKFQKVNGIMAAQESIKGELVISDMSKEILKEDHAHVALIYPVPPVMSASLNKLVAVCANIGKGDPGSALMPMNNGLFTKPNFICATSRAYPVIDGEADHWLWLRK